LTASRKKKGDKRADKEAGGYADNVSSVGPEAGGLKGDVAGDSGGAAAGDNGESRHGKEPATRNVLDADGAMHIFRMKVEHRPRDELSDSLGKQYGITAKAVRDIWNLRTWMNTTKHLWTPEDHARFLQKKLCADCRNKSVQMLSEACEKCRQRPTKGRPPTKVDESKLKELSATVSQADAAKELNISLATLKATCRRSGILKWPFEKESGMHSDLAHPPQQPLPAPPQQPLPAPPQQPVAMAAEPQLSLEVAVAAAAGYDGGAVGGLKPTGSRLSGRGGSHVAGGKAWPSPGRGRKRGVGAGRAHEGAGEDESGEAGTSGTDGDEERKKRARVMENPGGAPSVAAAVDAGTVQALQLMTSQIQQLSQEQRDAMARAGQANLLAAYATAAAAQEQAAAAAAGAPVDGAMGKKSTAETAGQGDSSAGGSLRGGSVLEGDAAALAALSSALDPMMIALCSRTLQSGGAVGGAEGETDDAASASLQSMGAVHMPVSAAALSSALSLSAMPQFAPGSQQEAARALLALQNGNLAPTAAAIASLVAAGNRGVGLTDLGFAVGGGNGAQDKSGGAAGKGGSSSGADAAVAIASARGDERAAAGLSATAALAVAEEIVADGEGEVREVGEGEGEGEGESEENGTSNGKRRGVWRGRRAAAGTER
jgi:hypothetical protein